MKANHQEVACHACGRIHTIQGHIFNSIWIRTQGRDLPASACPECMAGAKQGPAYRAYIAGVDKWQEYQRVNWK